MLTRPPDWIFAGCFSFAMYGIEGGKGISGFRTLLSHMTEKQNQEYTCEVCEEAFETEHGLKVHKGKKHRESTNDERDSQAAVLTNAQRAYLNGEKEYRPSTKDRVDERIGKRVNAGMLDFAILFNQLSQEQIVEIFQPMASSVDTSSAQRGEIPVGNSPIIHAPGVISFLLRGLNYDEKPLDKILAEQKEPQPAFANFVDALEQGIDEYIAEYTDYLADVNVSIDLDGLDHDEEFYEELKGE